MNNLAARKGNQKAARRSNSKPPLVKLLYELNYKDCTMITPKWPLEIADRKPSPLSQHQLAKTAPAECQLLIEAAMEAIRAGEIDPTDWAEMDSLSGEMVVAWDYMTAQETGAIAIETHTGEWLPSLPVTFRN